jgi:hypothetical protein
MRRKLTISLVAIVALGLVFSVWYVVSVRRSQRQMARAVAGWKKDVLQDWHKAFEVYYVHRRLRSQDIELSQMITNVALDHLADLEDVSGYAVEYAGGPGEFYTASLILSACLSDEDFLRMAGDKKPMVRAMALICLARRDMTRYQSTIQRFCNDPAEVQYMPAGCISNRISLGVLAKSILDDPNTLQYWNPEKTRWLWQRK